MSLDISSIGPLVGFVSLVGLVWKMGATTARFEAAVVRLQEELKAFRQNVDAVPLLLHRMEKAEERLEQIERELDERGQ